MPALAPADSQMHRQQRRHRYNKAAASSHNYAVPVLTSLRYWAGDGFGKRAEDAVLHGCLPVQIGDNITDKFQTILDWDSFTTRIPEADIERVPEILLRYTDEQVSLLLERDVG